LNVLEDFLVNFPGILILVSHDRYLIDKLTDQLFIFDGTGSVSIYNGNYADFKYEQDERIKEEKILEKKLKANPIVTITESSKKKLSFKEIKEYEELDMIIS